MVPGQSLEEWVQEKYETIGIDKHGQFIGKKPFKEALIRYFRNTIGPQPLNRRSQRKNELAIRQIVNAKGYLPTGTTAFPSQAEARVPPLTTNPSPQPPHAKEKASGSTAKHSPMSEATASSSTAKAPLKPSNSKAEASISTSSNSKGSSPATKVPVQPPHLKFKRSGLIATSSTAQALSHQSNKRVETNSSKPGEGIKSVEPEVGIGSNAGSDSGIDTHSIEDGILFNQLSTRADYEISTAPDIHIQVPLNRKIQELIADTKRSLVQNLDEPSGSDRSPKIPSMEDQLRLLDLSDYSDSSHLAGLTNNDIRNAVIFSTEVLERSDSELLPQYGLLGSICPMQESNSTANTDPRLFLNVNIPFSAFICGLQGSGKSHTMSCILENSLIKAPILGVLEQPLSALVFHFSQYTSRSSFRPCEAAFLAYRHPNFRDHTGVSSIHIMVPPSNYHDLNELYSPLPDVHVRPFKLQSKDLNISSMLNLMSVDQTEAAPLYIGQIRRILREIATESTGPFDYLKFKDAIKACKFTWAQKGPLQQRLDILESFLDLDNLTVDYSFEAGSLTIIDLSCPFVDANTACVLFNICIDMYLGSHPGVGKLIAIDEAHKYMTNTPASKALTETLLTVIRQQRHYGARVIISTQEPTISPRLMDLCSIIIIHRFSSPEWFEIVRKHVSIAETDKAGLENLFTRIVKLGVGEALLFAPSTILSRWEESNDVLVQLSSDLLKAKIRNRLTWDGGKSVVCM